MLNRNLAIIVLVVFAAGCGIEARTYVMTKPRVGLDQTGGNIGCVVGTCPPPPPPTETTRKVYVLELTKPVPESEVQKIEESAVNAIADSAPAPSSPETAPTETAPAADDNSQPASTQPAVPVVGELPGQESSETAPAEQNGGNMQGGNSQGVNSQAKTYTVLKDDTLQKISKKVYGTYGKWYKIYEANKDKIKNPNFVKPGTVLTIPVLK